MLPFPKQTMKHLRFQRMEIDKPRYKPPKPPSNRPSKDNIKHGTNMELAASIVVKSFEEEQELTPPEFDPAFVFKIKLDSKVPEDEWRRSKLVVLSEEPDGVVVLFSPDQLAEFRQRISKFGEEIEEDKKPHYAWIAQLTEDMSLWNRENRLGRKLRKEKIDDSATYLLDIELWTYGNKDDNEKRFLQFKEFISHNHGKILDKYKGEELYLARIKITGEVLNRLLDVGIIHTIDLPPQPDMSIGEIFQSSIEGFGNQVEAPEDTTVGVCIIDSGVATGHPLLSKAIGDAKSFPVNIGLEVDQNGHGTHVAGIGLYGNIRERLNGLNFKPEFYIFSARVTNKQNYFDDEKLIVNQMHEAITYFHETYNCRIFNISLADPNLIYEDGKPSQWANILDQLAHDLDILIVVACGNIQINGISGNEAEHIRASYPDYLLESNAKLLEPATSINSITVGSITHSDQSFLSSRNPNDLIQPIAPVNAPSPFTRRGPGVNGSIKPDVVEYGGNSTWSRITKSIVSHDPGVEIVSTNYEYHISSLFKTDCGTSFSTPKITYLAGLILKNYPDCSANLMRGLIANSAEIPAIANDIFSTEDDILSLYGYGLPDPDKALYSTQNRVTIFAEDIINCDTIHVYAIPIPEKFKITNGKRRISISLVFDPPVRHTRKEYIGVNLSFKLVRGISTDQIVKAYSDHQNKNDAIPPKYNCDLKPSQTRRDKGTLQKGVFNVSRNSTFTDYDGDIYHLVIFSSKGWISPDIYPSQRYAVVVTLEHLDAEINLYADLQNKLPIEVRDRARIRG